MTKGEKTVLESLLEQVKEHRLEVQAHAEVLARLDERTFHIQTRIEGVESRINRRASAVGAIVGTIVSAIVAGIFALVGWPRA